MSFYATSHTNYKSSATQSVPAVTRTLLQCDGLAPLTNEAECPGSWNPATSKIMASAVGEVMGVRITFDVTLLSILGLSVAPLVIVDLDIGGTVGKIGIDSVPMGISASPQPKLFYFPVFVGDTFLANGCQIYVTMPTVGATLSSTAVTVFRFPRAL